MTVVDGIADLARLTGWLESTLPGTLDGPLAVHLIPGGRSNLTYEIRSGAGSWVLRRPPLGDVLATAHDIGREYRVMSALAGTDVPVPGTYALCRDEAVIGAPFYVMEKVDGIPYRSAAQLAPLGADRVRTISQRLPDILVALHQVDPTQVGLADLGRADGFLARQLRRWHLQLEASKTRDLPAADELRNRLMSALPAQSPPAIIHGDYRLDNLLVDRADRPAALIDWEMAAIGDPLLDLALLIVYHQFAQLPGGDAVYDVGSAPGFLTVHETIDRYVAGGGRPPDSFGFYLGLAAFKLAAIAENVHHRHLQGCAPGGGPAPIGALTEPLLQLGLSSLEDDH